MSEKDVCTLFRIVAPVESDDYRAKPRFLRLHVACCGLITSGMKLIHPDLHLSTRRSLHLHFTKAVSAVNDQITDGQSFFQDFLISDVEIDENCPIRLWASWIWFSH